MDSEKFYPKIYGVNQFKGAKQDITGKKEIVRNHMQAKRVDFVNRTVATPDPTLEFGEIGIPEDVAKAQSFPDEVNLFNILALTNMLRLGMVHSIMPTSGPSKNILIEITDQNRDTINLEVGVIVHREILDGDLVVSNRNPSIHMYSMMGGTAKRRKQKTISPQMAQTTPGQIDFDGDEINLHFVQNIQGAADIKHLMYLSRNFDECTK